MGRISVSELEFRKRALVNESEYYRETLKAEVHGLTLYARGIGAKIERARGIGQWVALAAPLIGLFYRRKTKSPPSSKLKRGMSAALLGFRLWRSYAPAIKPFIGQFFLKKRATSTERSTAA